ncbi:MAG: hypothetical protein LBS19_11965 [Clostridiales bacterium]|nr:hypothetical protein [Clostridiales bacterium]
MANFLEAFTLYRRSVRSGSPDWAEAGAFKAAITTGTARETGEGSYSGSQRINVRTVTKIYVHRDEANRPGYDDFIRREATGEVFRVVVDGCAAAPPAISRIKYYELEVENAELPPFGAGEGDMVE